VRFYGPRGLRVSAIIWLFASPVQGLGMDGRTVETAASVLMYLMDEVAMDYWLSDPPADDQFWTENYRRYVVVSSFTALLPPVIGPDFLGDLLQGRSMRMIDLRSPY
jgi:hypothetical protein